MSSIGRSQEVPSMTADRAIGMAVNQHLFARGLTAPKLVSVLGVSHSSVHRKIRGSVGWSVSELLALADFFGVEVQDLMPVRDGLGGWLPAPYSPSALVSTGVSSGGMRKLRTGIASTSAEPRRAQRDSNPQPSDP